MEATLDDLLNDINSSDNTDIRITIHTGSEVIIKSFHYKKLRIGKDDKGTVFLGNYDNWEGYTITDEYEINKSDNNQDMITYDIRQDDIPLIDIYIK